jgi:hypothetical protein
VQSLTDHQKKLIKTTVVAAMSASVGGESAARVRVLPHYECRETADLSTATSKHGLFATQDIEPGTRIICEYPFLGFASERVKPVQIKIAMAKLAAHQRAKLWKLNPLPSVEDSAMTELAEEVRDVCRYLEDQYDGEEKTEEEDAIHADFTDVLRETASRYRLYARWEAAKRHLVEKVNQTTKGQAIIGMFIEEALLQHSCNPNCFTNCYNNIMTVHTTRAVAAGEELTASLIRSPYFKRVEYRDDELLQLRSLFCTCDECDEAHPNFYRHEALRANIYECMLELDKSVDWQTRMEPRYDREDMQRTQTVTVREEQDEIELCQLVETEQKILAIISDLQEIGCDTPDLVRFYLVLIERISPRIAQLLDNDDDSDSRISHLELTFRSIQECVRVVKKCCGADNPMIADFRQRGKKVMEAIIAAKRRGAMLEASRAKLAGLVGKEVKGEMDKAKDEDEVKDKQTEGEDEDSDIEMEDAEDEENEEN